MASNRVLRVLVEGQSFLAILQRVWCGERVDGRFVLEWKAGEGSKISHCVKKFSFSHLSAFGVQNIVLHMDLLLTIETRRHRLRTRREYKIYAQHYLDYASVVYSPYYLYLIDTVESVQHHFTKRLHNFCNLSYVNRQQVTALESFELRRL